MFYKIGTADDLYSFACMVNNGGASINGMLTADIEVNVNLLGTDDANVKADGSFNVEKYGAEPKPWTPIGNEYVEYSGTFDGNGYTVSGLYFSSTTDSDIGFFGNIGEGATVQNVGVVNSYIKGNSNVGGVAGYNNGGTVSKAYYNTDVCENCNNTVGTGKTFLGIIALDVPNVFGAAWEYGYTSIDESGVVTFNFPYLKNIGSASQFKMVAGTLTSKDGFLEIGTADELKMFVGLVDTGGSFKGKLTKDICLNACGEGESLLDADGNLKSGNFSQWTPMKAWDENATIVLDGNGHTISGLYFNDEYASSIGLFSYVAANVSVSNLGIVDSYIKAKENVGAFAGNIYGGMMDITNSYNEGTFVVTFSAAGGFVGNIDNATLNITQSYNAGSLTNIGVKGTAEGDYTGWTVGGLVANAGWTGGSLNIVK